MRVSTIITALCVASVGSASVEEGDDCPESYMLKEYEVGSSVTMVDGNVQERGGDEWAKIGTCVEGKFVPSSSSAQEVQDDLLGSSIPTDSGDPASLEDPPFTPLDTIASGSSASVEDGEFKNITIWNDNTTHMINDEASSFNDETVVVKDNTTLRIDANGYITAPINGYKSDTDWPAVQLSIGSVLIANGGSITGPSATMEGTHGGEGIELYNGQSGPETASFAYFYDGVSVTGGDAVDGVGGNALHVHGFGTEAFIYGGNFQGGKGSNSDNGLSINALLGGAVHIHSGTFDGDLEVGDSSTVTFYGCFLQNGTIVSGEFVDETTLSVNVRSRNGGEILLVSVAEQECETAPSMSPTNFPTLSPQPTVPRPNDAGKVDVTYYGWIIAGFALLPIFCR